MHQLVAVQRLLVELKQDGGAHIAPPSAGAATMAGSGAMPTVGVPAPAASTALESVIAAFVSAAAPRFVCFECSH
jgi:hypothetical protein